MSNVLINHTHTHARTQGGRERSNTYKISKLVKFASCAGIPPVK